MRSDKRLYAKGQCLEAVAEAADVVVEHTAETEYQHTEGAEEEGYASVNVALERRYRAFVGLDVHGLDDEQIVVERDDGIGQSNEHQQRIAGLEGCHEYEELAEESCKGRNTCQREEAERHEERKLRIALVESVVVADVDLTAVFLYRGHHSKGSEVGHHIYEEVEHESGHAL